MLIIQDLPDQSANPEPDVNGSAPGLGMIEGLDCFAFAALYTDACMAEEAVERLRRSLLGPLYATTGESPTEGWTSTLTESDWETVRDQVLALAGACRICADECSKKAGLDATCQMCAEACRRCEDACLRLLCEMPDGMATQGSLLRN